MNMTGKKVMKKSKSMDGPQENKCSSEPKRSASGFCAMKTRIMEMGPICKSRKKYERDSPTSKQEDDDEGFVWLFGKASPSQQESLWLSSESFSPLYEGGDFKSMSPRDYSIDERLVSLLSSYSGIVSFDGSYVNPILEASLALEEVLPEDETWLLDCSSNQESSSTALSSCSVSSSLFWDLDRTDLWVSLINLDGEDCNWISNFDLDSDFPSPTYENTRGSDVDVSSSIRSVHNDLLMWPFDGKHEWSYTSDSFSQSPRRGIGASTALSRNEGRRKGQSKEWWDRRFAVASGSSASKIIGFKHGSRRIIISSRNTKVNRSSRNSMKMMLSASKLGKKHKFGKGNLVMSAKRLQAMSLVGVDEFNWLNCSGGDSSDEYSNKYSTSSHKGSSTTTDTQSHSASSSMDLDNAGLWVSLINLNEDSDEETDWEEDLQSDFPSPSYKNRRNQIFFSSETDVSELSVEILSYQIDADEPLFWPYDGDWNWSVAWDSFCASPHKGTHRREVDDIFGSPASIRVRIHNQRLSFNKGCVAVSGLSASKIIGFKRGNGKKGNARRAKGKNPRIRRSVARKFARNVAGKMDAIMENDVEGFAVEAILGLDEFDGHEGLDREFHTESFSILEE